jgi:hypothetical protein
MKRIFVNINLRVTADKLFQAEKFLKNILVESSSD